MELKIVYEDLDLYLKDISTLSQYIQNIDGNYKLITFLGEFHGVKNKCPIDKKIIDLNDYITNILDVKNISTSILVELDKSMSESKILSHNLSDILKNKDIYKSIIFIDFRNRFLTNEDIYILYSKVEILNNMSYENIVNKYIKPFYEKIEEYIFEEDIDKLYYPLVYDLYKVYLVELNKSFEILLNELKNCYLSTENVNTLDYFGSNLHVPKKIAVLMDLKQLWARVSDFFVLRELFKKNDIKQYIIFNGEYHYKNLIQYMDEFMCKITDENSKHYFKNIIKKDILFSIKSKNTCFNLENTVKYISK